MFRIIQLYGLFPMVGLLLATPLWADNACHNLANLNIDQTSITMAEPVAPGRTFSDPFVEAVITKPFCQVQATIMPTPDSRIGIEVWLPTSQNWNGKYLGTGNGGAGGSILYSYLAPGLEAGYATANQDMGSSSGGMGNFEFGIGHPEKVVDFSHRAAHLMTVVAKQIINAYYGQKPQYSYFQGCSSGGHQALAEAQKYPADYDGIIAANPANNRTHQHMYVVWAKAALRDGNREMFPPEKVPALSKAVMNACDGLDGLYDGLIDDPRRCQFDPAELQCSAGEDQADCLTEFEVGAMRKLYAGPSNPRTGEHIFPGMTRGSEALDFGVATFVAWAQATGPSGDALLAWQSGWDHHTKFDFDRDQIRVDEKLGPLVNYTNPDLSAFKKRGGKIIMYTGWADPLIPPEDLLNYYNSVAEMAGGMEKAKDFARLFMLPGYGHCIGGPGPNHFDAVGVIDKWVADKQPPQKFVATKYQDDDPQKAVLRTRPICLYPKVARWNGTGSIDNAANFDCE